MSRQLLAKVHIAKKELGLDDEVYRAILRRLTGQESAKGLTVRELDTVLVEFQRLGWEPKAATEKPKRSSDKRIRKIWAIWGELCRRGETHTPTKAGLRAFVQNRTGVSDPEWLKGDDIASVLNELVSWQQRARRRTKP